VGGGGGLVNHINVEGEMSNELDVIKAELSEWRELAQDRLNHIRFLEGRLAVIERGCGVIEKVRRNNMACVSYRPNVGWSVFYLVAEYNAFAQREETAPSLLGLIEKVGGAE
jgi:hypothetical protein